VAVLVAAAAGGVLWARTWHQSRSAGETAAVRVTPTAGDVIPGPYTDAPTPSGEAQLLYSTRTWKSYLAGQPETTGFVELFQRPGGELTVRLAGLSAPVVPGESLLLSPAAYTSGAFGSGGLTLGRLGGSDYPIPAGTDLSKYASIVLWNTGGSTPVAAAPFG
jgi:hypothetical protein